MGMIQEFKEFAVKGNMVDMAVGIILGAAFGTIVSSLVGDVIMPIVSGIGGLPDFSNLFVGLTDGLDSNLGLDAYRDAGGSAIAYGKFINAIISFLIVAFVLFMIIRGLNKAKLHQEAVAETPANEILLAEIRDLLKK